MVKILPKFEGDLVTSLPKFKGEAARGGQGEMLVAATERRATLPLLLRLKNKINQ